MHRLLLFTRRGRLIFLYLFLSLLASIVIFLSLKGHVLEEETSTEYGHSEKSRPVPEPKVNREFPFWEFKDLKKTPLHTEMNCVGKDANSRICFLKNLCYSPRTDRFFSLPKRGERLQAAWKGEDEDRLLDLTTISKHNVFYFNFEEDKIVAEEEFDRSYQAYRFVKKKTFMFSRFVYNNIMHNIHDDFLGQFILHRNFSSSASSSGSTVDMDNFIFFADGYVETLNDHLFSTLSEHPFMYRSELKSPQSPMPPICFADLVVGNAKDAVWYDYGFFDSPQGPIEDKELRGDVVKEAAEYLFKYYEIRSPSSKSVQNILKLVHKEAQKSRREPKKPKLAPFLRKDFYISIFSRTQDRIILNEEELIEELQSTFKLPVKLVQLENLGFDEILRIMSRTIVAVGLHGSALIYAMFMPKNSVLLEMFPYAVPGENYIPYQTLSRLSGIELTYASWTNRHATRNFAQIGQRKLFDDLTPELLANVLSLKTVPPHICCGDMYWTVRIYQDTLVEIGEIKAIVSASIKKSISRQNNQIVNDRSLLQMSQRKVQSIAYDVKALNGINGQDKVEMHQMLLKWPNPWSKLKMKPSKYGIWIEEMIEEIFSDTERLAIEFCLANSTFNVWIRPFRYDQESAQDLPAAPFSKKFSLKCVL